MVEKRFITKGIVKPEEIIKEDLSETYGKFIITPFERGFGTTIGNALRRVLLSSIVGVAVTSVKIEGVKHEYEVIDGVVEDVSEIILNLKNLSISMDEGEKAVLTIDESGTKVIRAKDIKTPANVKINNPDLVILNLTGGKFKAELNIGVGRGYVLSDDNFNEEAPQYTIFTDSIYTPVTKVKYQVEKTRVGHSTDYDKLILELWTNGAINPEDAIAYAGKILKDYFSMFINFQDIEVETEETDLTPEEQRLKEILHVPIDELELSVRSANCLKDAKIKTLGELSIHSENDMLKTRNFGKKSLREIKKKLSDFGLTLGMNNIEHLIEE